MRGSTPAGACLYHAKHAARVHAFHVSNEVKARRHSWLHQDGGGGITHISHSASV